MFCESCGNTIKKKAKFCGKCGHAISEEPMPTPTDEQKQEEADRSVWYFGIAWKILFLFFVVGIGGVMIFGYIAGTMELNSMNNEYGDCLDVVNYRVFDPTWSEWMSERGYDHNAETDCRMKLRDTHKCLDAFEAVDYIQQGKRIERFHDELECWGWLKNEAESTCQKGGMYAEFTELHGIKC